MKKFRILAPPPHRDEVFDALMLVILVKATQAQTLCIKGGSFDVGQTRHFLKSLRGLNTGILSNIIQTQDVEGRVIALEQFDEITECLLRAFTKAKSTRENFEVFVSLLNAYSDNQIKITENE